MKIGGEFEYMEYGKLSKNSLYQYLLKRFSYIQFFFSGRSVLYSLFKFINENKTIDTVYLPAYLCESISFPIRKAIEGSAIKIVFYPQNERLCSNIGNIADNSIVYIIDYFGKIDKLLLERVKKGKRQHSNVILVRDVTHSLFVEQYEMEADYYICSLRKWTFLPDRAFVASNLHEIKRPLEIANDDYVQARLVASMLKRLNIAFNPSIFKDVYFLSIFQFCEKELNKYLNDIKISDFSLKLLHKIDYKDLITRRSRNKKYLLDKIAKFTEFSVIDGEFSFFTITVLFKKGKDRDSFRRKMAEIGIFLPVHWPIEWQKDIDEDVYYHNRNIADRILSFVIDQRYGEREMKFEADAIIRAIKG